jgi:UDP-N-acetylglucosamine 2-epimerase (non-hydrolysing)
MTIVGTRPELIKMSRVIEAMDRHFDHVLVHTGQNFDYELNQVFFDDLGIRKPDHFMEAAGETAIETIAAVLTKSDRLMAELEPDAVLIYGDTNSGLACISAKRRKIPIFHFEAGNRSFDARVPEEVNRRIIDHTSDINLVLTEHARRYLLAEGLPGDFIFKTGSHMPEVLAEAMPRIEASGALDTLGLQPDRYILVSAHREENVDALPKLRRFTEALNRLATDYDMPVVVSTHPRTRKRLETLGDLSLSEKVRFQPPFGFLDYIKLQKEAFCVVSDSGTIAEEASLLNLPAVTVRDAHERPEGMDVGTLVMAGVGAEEIARAVALVRADFNRDAQASGLAPDYADAGRVSIKAARIVESYIEVVNRVVWRRY